MLIAKNKKGVRNYEILQKFTAGISLKGYEVKSVRENNVSFEGSYIKMIDNRPYVVGLHIGRYSKQSQDSDTIDAKRDRALLLNKREILKIQQELNEKGKSAIPVALILQNNLVKLEIAVVKGRKAHQKKHVEKERQIRKDLEKYTAQMRKGNWDQ